MPGDQLSGISFKDHPDFLLPLRKVDNKKLISGLLKPKAITELSKKQKTDYEKFEYLCYDKVYIPGTIPMKRSNLIVVNGNEIKIGDSLFSLSLRFVIEPIFRRSNFKNNIFHTAAPADRVFSANHQLNSRFSVPFSYPQEPSTPSPSGTGKRSTSTLGVESVSSSG